MDQHFSNDVSVDRNLQCLLENFIFEWQSLRVRRLIILFLVNRSKSLALNIHRLTYLWYYLMKDRFFCEHFWSTMRQYLIRSSLLQDACPRLCQCLLLVSYFYLETFSKKYLLFSVDINWNHCYALSLSLSLSLLANTH